MRRRAQGRWLVVALLLGCRAELGDVLGDATPGKVDAVVAALDAPPPARDAGLPDAAPAPDAQVGCTDGTPEGTCAPHPCESVACTGGACVYAPLPDGASCGAGASSRCCGAACVDTSTDAANCGGCGLACGAGLTCESVALTA